MGACVDVDVSGFTPATEALSQHGREGAELLAEIIRAVFEPLACCVYEHGGFVANYTGDGFLAVFPSDGERRPDATAALAAAWRMRQAIRSRHSYRTPLGTFLFNARIGAAVGEVGWRILADRRGRRHAWCFLGDTVLGAARARRAAAPGGLYVDPGLLHGLASGARIEVTARGPVAEIVEAERLPAPSLRGLADGKVDPLVTAFYPAGLACSSAPGEFRHSVNLFLNFDGAASDLERFAAAIFAAQERCGGYLQSITEGETGCAALLFWGAPIATENDVGRALEFATELLARPDLRLRASLTQGVSHAGFLGSPAYEVYGCHSSAVNLAARLMAAAEPGRLLMDGATRDQALVRFRVESAGERLLKGFARPQPVYALGERRTDVAPVRTRGPLVDRDGDLRRLRRMLLDSLGDGRGEEPEGGRKGVALVVGEAGSGKSSFVAALGRSLADAADAGRPAPRWIEVGPDHLSAKSLGPFRRVLREILGVDAGLSPAERSARFDAALDAVIAEVGDGEVAAELRVTRAFLGALVDVTRRGSAYFEVGPEARALNTTRALAAFFRALAAARPVILVVEDLHEQDAGSRALLARLAAQPPQGLALLVTSRPDDEGGLSGLPFDERLVRERVELASLSREGVRIIAERALDAQVSPRIVEFLVQKTGGNPFHLEQMLVTLGARGAFVTRDGGAQAHVELAPDAAEGIPPGVSGILTARIDKLGAGLKTVVQAAAALGYEVEVRLLRAILPDDGLLDQRIETGVAQQIWERRSADRLRFRHPLLRDVAYAMQLGVVRRDLHRRAAAALQGFAGPPDLERLGALAFHFEHADMPAEARRHLQLAGDAAHDGFETVSAVHFYRRLLAHPLDAALEVTVCARLGELLGVTADWEEAVAVLERGLSNLVGAREPRRQIEMLIALGDVLRKSNDHPRARERLELASSLARRTGDALLEGKAAVVLAGSYKYAGDHPRTLEIYHEALAIGERIGDRRLIGVSLAGVGSALGLMGDVARAIDYNRRAIPILEGLGDRQELVYPLSNLGIDLFTVGALAESATMLQRSLEQSDTIGDREGVWFAHHFLGRVRHREGEHAAAIACYERAMRERQALGGDGIPFETLPHLAAAHAAAGEIAAAVRTVAAHLDRLAQGEPDREHGFTHLMAARLLGGLTAKRGDGGDIAGLLDGLARRGPGRDPEGWFRLAEQGARAGGPMGLAARVATLADYAQFRHQLDPRDPVARGCLAAAHALAVDNALEGERRVVETVAAGCGVADLAGVAPLYLPFGDDAEA